MNSLRSAGVSFVAFAMACGSSDLPKHEIVGSISAPIQGGTTDTTHSFAVGIFNQAISGVCSGALLAPNLVATARHCVAQISSSQVDCATTSFGANSSPGEILVTTDAQLGQNASWHQAKHVITPQPTKVCGNDIALVILGGNITLPAYVTPSINPPMTDHKTYATFDTAIGYGIDAPNDQNSAGVRRIKQNIELSCIPNDTKWIDCFSDPSAKQYLSANEFVSGDGTCEGDSGSSAYDQKSFDNGKWVSFGVLSRGGVSQDGTQCQGSVYSRFDAWAQLVIDAAKQAAQEGGYPPPDWTNAPPPGSDGGTTGGATDGGDAGSSTGRADGQSCDNDSQCTSHNCVSTDGTNFVCASACSSDSDCGDGLSCQGGFCFAKPDGGTPGGNGSQSFGTGSSGGCSVGSAIDPTQPTPWRSIAAGLGLAAFAVARRRRRP